MINNNDTYFEQITIKDLVSGINSNKYILPNFQRSPVWDHEQVVDLLKSIENDFPIGVMLLYEKNDNTFEIIDGLQRSYACRDFFNDTGKYFTKISTIKDILKKVNFIEINLDDEKTKEIITKWFSEIKSYDKDFLDKNKLATIINEKHEKDFGDSIPTKQYQELINFIELNILKSIQEYFEKIINKNIPVIVYKGESSNLPNIFEKLNSGGTPLSKYDLYAARWYEHILDKAKIKLLVDGKIIKCIEKIYKKKEDSGFLYEFHEGNVTAYDYLLGINDYINEEFFQKNSINRGKTKSYIAFNIFSNCLSVKSSEMEILGTKIQDEDYIKLFKDIIESIEILIESLYFIIDVNVKGENSNLNISEYCLVSYIGKIYRCLNDKDNLKILKSNIPKYLIYDTINEEWKGTGDSKSVSYSYGDLNNRYLNNLDFKEWDQLLNNWFKTQMQDFNDMGRKQISKTNQLFLTYLYTDTLTNKENKKKKRQIDHMVSIQTSKDKKLHSINCIGNLASLTDIENQEKRTSNLIDFINTKIGKNEDIEKLKKNFFLKDDLNELKNPINQDEYDKFLKERFEIIKKKFYSTLEIKENLN